MKSGKQKLYEKFLPYIPYTTLYLVKRFFNLESNSILDVGCGTGDVVGTISKRKKSFNIGIDLFWPYLKECQRKKVFNGLVKADVRSLPFRGKQFDTILCIWVLEHLEKKEGLRLINELEKMARKQVIIATTVGFLPRQEIHNNPLQEHRSSWEVEEFKKRNYKIYGQECALLYRLMRRTLKVPGLKYLFLLVASLFAPLVYRLPSLASQMICVKRLKI